MRTERFKCALLSALLIASLMSLLLISAEAAWGQDIEWTRQFGTSAKDQAHSVAVDGSGNVYVSGFTYGAFPGQTYLGDYDVFVRKYDGSGNELWTRQFGSSTTDYAFGVAVDTSGNIYVAGSTDGALPGQTSSGSYDAFVRKYDSLGNELWTKQFGISTSDIARGVAVDGYDNVYIAGYTSGYDKFVRKYDGSGNELWTRQFWASDYQSGYAESVAVDGSGNVYVASHTDGALPGQAYSGSEDTFVRKYDGSGNEIWTRQFGTSAYDDPFGVAVDASGNVYVAGRTSGTLPGQASSGDYDAFVRKYDGAGSELWTRQFGTSDYDSASAVAVDASDNVYIAGGTGGELPGQSLSGYSDAFVRKYDSNGDELWTKQFGTSDSEGADGVAVDPSGNIYVAGSTYGARGWDAFLVKFGEAAPTNYTPYLVGGAVAIVMIVIVAALYMRRRKPREAMFGS